MSEASTSGPPPALCLASVLFDAKDAGFKPLILTDTGRNITEGPGFNVFAFKHGKLLTSSHGVLFGITHRTVLEIATELDLQVDIRPVPHTVFFGCG